MQAWSYCRHDVLLYAVSTSQILSQIQSNCVQEDQGIKLPFFSSRLFDGKYTGTTASSVNMVLCQDDPALALLRIHEFLAAWQPLHELEHHSCKKGDAGGAQAVDGPVVSNALFASSFPSEQFVINCLERYLTACLELRSADLQGEFAAFHWLTGSLEEAGWSNRGAPLAWPQMSLYYDPVKQTEFIMLVSQSMAVEIA
ncbi:unnamed protein product [Protopolystoma xenopodis]|uniref:Uncharacterized protein n=1 Tax=Protopolystoma xenopodis TaxID=117903 RepID=A0A3S5AZ08_9PLAT|nr:unnamed protein product [Protopolystoma xenopodis]